LLIGLLVLLLLGIGGAYYTVAQQMKKNGNYHA
jgi:hypothetical protein